MSAGNRPLDIIAVRTDDGKHYIAERGSCIPRYHESVIGKLLFDGKNPAPTFYSSWFVLDAQPEKITMMVPQPDINHRYEMQDKSLISDKLPEFIDRKDVAEYDSEAYEWVWFYDMRQYRSLYKAVSDKQPPKEEAVEFTFEIIASVKSVIPPADISYDVRKTRWESDGLVKLTASDVSYPILDRVIFPALLLPQRPCRLTSEQTYKIVRQYVKDNIKPELAKITSDYDFCFTVQRRIRLAKTKTYTIDTNLVHNMFSKRKRKSKYIAKSTDERGEICFEMTHTGNNYQGYTAIKGFEASNQQELKRKIDAYCEGLIKFINMPIAECKHCNGDGVIVPGKKGKAMMNKPERRCSTCKHYTAPGEATAAQCYPCIYKGERPAWKPKGDSHVES